MKLKTSALEKSVLREWKDTSQSEKIFANNVFDKGFVSGLYQELLKLNSKKTKTIIKLAKCFSRHSTKKDI